MDKGIYFFTLSWFLKRVKFFTVRTRLKKKPTTVSVFLNSFCFKSNNHDLRQDQF